MPQASRGEIKLYLSMDASRLLGGLDVAARRLRDFETGVNLIGAGIGVGLVGGLTRATNVGTSFESAFTGVEKTLTATNAEFALLEKQLRDLAADDIPLPFEDLAKIGELGGQLGIPVEQVDEFTETIAKLTVTTNLGTETAALYSQQFLNITRGVEGTQAALDAGIPIYEKFGSTVVALGNNTATTESEILDLGFRLAGAGRVVGLTESQILGLSAAMAQLAIPAEAGGTAITRVLLNIQRAVDDGGDELQRFAKISNVTAGDFAKLFRQDASEALLLFLRGLAQLQTTGQNVSATLEGVGFNTVRIRETLLRLIGDVDQVEDALDVAFVGFAEGSALAEEADRRFDDTRETLIQMSNAFREASASLGESFLPTVRAAAELLGGFAQILDLILDSTGPLVPSLIAASAAFLAVRGVAGLLGHGLGLVAGALNQTTASATATTASMGGLSAGMFSAGGSALFLSKGLTAISRSTPVLVGLSAVAAALPFIFRDTQQAVLDVAESIDPILVAAIAAVGGELRNLQDAQLKQLFNDLISTDDVNTLTDLGFDMAELTEIAIRFAEDGIEPASGALLSFYAVGEDSKFVDQLTEADRAFAELAGTVLSFSEDGDADYRVLLDTLNTLVDGLVGLESRGRAVTATEEDFGVVTDAATQSVLAQTGALGDLDSQMDQLDGAIKRITSGLTQMGAAADFTDDLQGLAEALADNGRTFSLNSAAGRDNISVLQGVISSMQTLATTTLEQTGSAEEANRVWFDSVTQLQALLINAGITDTAILGMVGSLAQLSASDFDVEVNVDTDAAARNIEETTEGLRGLAFMSPVNIVLTAEDRVTAVVNEVMAAIARLQGSTLPRENPLGAGGQFVEPFDTIFPDRFRRILDPFVAPETGGGGGGGGGGGDATEDEFREFIEALDRLYEIGDIDRQEYLTALEQAIAQEERLSDNWFEVWRRRRDVLAEIGEQEAAVLRERQEVIDDILQQTRARQDEFVQLVDDFESAVVSAITATGDLVELFSGDQNLDSDALVEILEHRLEATERFTEAMDQLQQRGGLSPDLLGDLAQAGPEALGLAEALTGLDPSRINDFASQFESLGQGLADNVIPLVQPGLFNDAFGGFIPGSIAAPAPVTNITIGDLNFDIRSDDPVLVAEQVQTTIDAALAGAAAELEAAS